MTLEELESKMAFSSRRPRGAKIVFGITITGARTTCKEMPTSPACHRHAAACRRKQTHMLEGPALNFHSPRQPYGRRNAPIPDETAAAVDKGGADRRRTFRALKSYTQHCGERAGTALERTARRLLEKGPGWV
ncbi:hypothetical protein HED48_22455 [Ochrobactrum intermedium]|nr:hypothetical protein [Brucella intermedia]